MKKRTLEDLQQTTLKYSSYKAFMAGDCGAYSVASRRGILRQICSHMPPPVHEAYSDEEIEFEALKHKNRKDFERASVCIYNAARKKGKVFLDRACSHMNLSLTQAYTDEELRIEANKYDKRVDFARGSWGAYQVAVKRGKTFLDNICRHMKPSNGSSNPEKELLVIAKSVSSKAITYRDSNVFIPGKPHIHGFDLDIYVPELNKAIEFDGTYWHSLRGLKRSRSHWPEQDLIDYHQTKDDWFASKGIQILHIKEENWIKDKDSCIKKCLQFLGVE